jgi:hypothetical protein
MSRLRSPKVGSLREMKLSEMYFKINITEKDPFNFCFGITPYNHGVHRHSKGVLHATSRGALLHKCIPT